MFENFELKAPGAERVVTTTAACLGIDLQHGIKNKVDNNVDVLHSQAVTSECGIGGHQIVKQNALTIGASRRMSSKRVRDV